MSAPQPAAAPSAPSPASFPTRQCTSCGRSLRGKGTVSFPCPQCGATGLGRCYQCRDQSVVYRCPACGFQGP